ncbi:hypothetical protein BGZ93_001901, partial [Podila epicladia]
MVKGSECYLTPRCAYLTSIIRSAVWSYDQNVAQYNPFAFLHWIAPRALTLLIAWYKMDIHGCNWEAYKLAREPKVLPKLKGG